MLLKPYVACRLDVDVRIVGEGEGVTCLPASPVFVEQSAVIKPSTLPLKSCMKRAIACEEDDSVGSDDDHSDTGFWSDDDCCGGRLVGDGDGDSQRMLSASTKT